MFKRRLWLALSFTLSAACASDVVSAPLRTVDAAADGGRAIDAGAEPMSPLDASHTPDATAPMSRLDASLAPDAAAADSSHADALAHDAGGHAGVDIVIHNGTGAPVYLQSAGTELGAALTLAVAGQPLRFEAGCEYCLCATCPSCAVCGRAFARVQRLEPDASAVYHWLGSVWQVEHHGCRPDLDCQSPSAAPSEEIEVSVTFSFSVTMELGANDTYIGPAQKATAVFRYVEGGDVDVVLR
jgi:hypothetical protein